MISLHTKRNEVNLALPKEIRDVLLMRSEQLDDWFDLNRNKYGYDGTDSFYQKWITDDSVLKFVSSICDIKAEVVYLLMTTPHYVIEKHVDDRTAGTKIALTWPLTPQDLSKMSPTTFHVYGKQKDYHYTTDEKSLIFNTRLPHSMVNNEHRRILFQIRYITSVERLVAALEKNGIAVTTGEF